MALGLGLNISSGGLTTPGIVTSNLQLKHNYSAGAVVPVSDGAALFNGSSDYIAIGAKPVDTADATYVFWAKSSETGENGGLFGHGTLNTGAFDINHSTTGKPLLYLASGHYQYWDDNGFADDGQWHHWAVVVDVSSVAGCKLYVDGALQNQSSATTGGTANAYGNMEIGRSTTSYEFDGYLCNFGVWSGLLSQTEIKSIMFKNYADLTTEEKAYKGDLVSWWNLDSALTTGGTPTLSDTPSVVGDAVYDNHDTTYTDISVTNNDFTSDLTTGWTNQDDQWTRVGDTAVSGTTSKLLSQNVGLTNASYKIVVNAKNTVTDSTGSMQVYIGANNYLRFSLTNDFEDYVAYGNNDETSGDPQVYVLNASSTNITVNSVTVQKFDGNPGILI